MLNTVCTKDLELFLRQRNSKAFYGSVCYMERFSPILLGANDNYLWWNSVKEDIKAHGLVCKQITWITYTAGVNLFSSARRKPEAKILHQTKIVFPFSTCFHYEWELKEEKIIQGHFSP